ncbi:hypothetical protein BCR36DRAFT_585470 [Piromyces finnis]|uniref:Fork-head domain-containing protein n=1 Tax=Piromyces finnis TaxID=1754191 RepID=A0A1Y1V3U9_9FUNG|nr:hypothetical protein BCR36DRAFT_585470 [Piromyces finnis]|eukprot:ORX46008.1 hypothetical protein BCR36DRAFT_585470 [Piromyces finnis]
MNFSSVKSSRYNKKNQKTKLVSFDNKKGAQNTQKPPYSYAELIAQAIISVPSYKLPLNKIYEWISTNYPFYKLSETGWQNSIRHNLSLNNSFCKVQRAENDPGKGCYWTIVKDQRHKFETLLSKKVGTKLTTTVVTKRSNPPKRKYSSYSYSESDLSESEYEYEDEDEDDMLYSERIIIRPKKVKRSESSDDMLYTEKSNYNKNKKSKKLALTRKTNVTQIPASPTPSPILTKREGNFSDNYKKYDDEDSESMIMEEMTEDEDDFDDYPPSPQSPEFSIHTHKNYDFTFDLFPEHPILDEEEDIEEEDFEEVEDDTIEAVKCQQDDASFSEDEGKSEEEESENEEYEFEEDNHDALPTIKISKSAVSLYDDIQSKTPLKENQYNFSESNEKMNTSIEMLNSNPVQREILSLHDKDDDINVLERYKNSYLSDYHGIDHNYSCYINEELDKQQYNYYLHSPIFNSLTCPELADMCFGVNLNTLDYTSLNEDFQNIPDKLDFVDMGVENWWRDEANNYPIY